MTPVWQSASLAGLRCSATANKAWGCALCLPIIQSQGTGSVTTERMQGGGHSTRHSHQLVNLYPSTHTSTHSHWYASRGWPRPLVSWEATGGLWCIGWHDFLWTVKLFYVFLSMKCFCLAAPFGCLLSFWLTLRRISLGVSAGTKANRDQ